MEKMGLSVVVPVYGCAGSVLVLCERLVNVLDTQSVGYEIILVNDGSSDGAWSIIQSLSADNSNIKGIDLSRNFGQHAAIAAGLEHSSGEWLIVMDCDLQDQPEEIPKFIAKAQEGFDVVFGRRYQRADSVIKKSSSLLYRKVFDYWVGTKSDPAICNFGIYNRKVIEAYLSMREQSRTLIYFVRWLGFRSTAIDIEHAPRAAGRSSYNTSKLVDLALNTIISHSNKPLKTSISFGFLMAFLALCYAGYIVYRYIFWGITVAGWTSTIVSIYFVGGLILANLGVLGLYLGKVFDEAKSRPRFVVREITRKD
jgi:glycosyltransferase involved in cell wall biosynthesis